MPKRTPGSRHRTPLWARHLRREVQIGLDLTVLAVAFAIAYLLRFDFRIPPENLEYALVQLPVTVLLQFAAVLAVGIYSFVWRYIGLAETRAFVKAAALSATPLLLLRLGLSEPHQVWRVPLSIILMDTVFAFGGLLAIRLFRRSLYERYERDRRGPSTGEGPALPVLLVGAGRAGVIAVRELQSRPDLGVRPVAFVDDDPLKQGSIIQGVRVVGTTDQIPRLARELEIDHAVVTIAEAPREVLRRIVETCERARLPVKTIPGLFELLQGRVSISRFRELRMEDLLGRRPVQLRSDAVTELMTDKAVLVTGAGGSIGSELCRQIATLSPARLLLVERAEGALFTVRRELERLWPDLAIEAVIADIGDAERIDEVLRDATPDVLFHAAAHKHVELMEENPREALKNNSLATHTLGGAAARHGVASFVLVSTDKAVRATSIMGASKRVAEIFVQDLQRSYPETRFITVRFGNVLGSAGSVVPIFREQIARGGPVTVTHPDVQRYFMTVSEASQLVLEAGALGKGGEVMTLDMGTPVSILELARDMIKLSGFAEDEVEIVFSGLRPGEKLTEELSHADEEIDRTRHPKIFIAHQPTYGVDDVARARERLARLVLEADETALRSFLTELLPEATLRPATGDEGAESITEGALG